MHRAVLLQPGEEIQPKPAGQEETRHQGFHSPLDRLLRRTTDPLTARTPHSEGTCTQSSRTILETVNLHLKPIKLASSPLPWFKLLDISNFLGN